MPGALLKRITSVDRAAKRLSLPLILRYAYFVTERFPSAPASPNQAGADFSSGRAYVFLDDLGQNLSRGSHAERNRLA